VKHGRMQAKDVPTDAVLRFIGEVDLSTYPLGATWFDCGLNSVRRAMPLLTPERVVLAKMVQLIRAGLVDGCACGCRGDFVLTAKGRERIGEGAPE
jgi:hypothetical protein